MPDWTRSMQQTYEYYVVDPRTWKDKEKLNNVKSCTINRDSGVETLGSATIDITESVGECYIRIYLITIQNGVTEKHPLGTFLVQTPSSNFNGKVREVTMDAYTPLLELKESPPPIGYSRLKGDNIMSVAHQLVRENARAPVVPAMSDKVLFDDFVMNMNDTWLTFISDMMSRAKYKFDLDEMGRILFIPEKNNEALQPVWTFDDGNSSILYPDFEMDHDLFGIPNVVEVAMFDGSKLLKSRVVNDDPNSPTSTVNREREIVYRDTEPELNGGTDDYVSLQSRLDQYAEQLLKQASSIEYTVSYSHGYCPVRVGDCVRLDYTRAGLRNITAKVVSQSITCGQGCKVTEKAVFTKKLWR